MAPLSESVNPNPRRLTFSQDLIYHVIEHCQDSIDTLQKCTLVSHNWLSVAQRHLFLRITVNNTIDDRDVLSFLQLLKEDRSFNLFVRHLRIINGQLGVHSATEIATKLPKIQSLTLESITITPAPTPASPLTEDAPLLSTHLKTLKFLNVSILNNPNLWCPLFDLTNIFESVEELTFNNLPEMRGELTVASPHTSPAARKTQVQNLNISPLPHYHPTPYIDCLLESVDMETVQTLTLSPWFGDEEKDHEAVIRAATNLKTLRISLESLGLGASSRIKRMNLKSCKSLHTLELTTRLLYHGNENNIQRLRCDFLRSIVMLSSLRLSLNPTPRVPGTSISHSPPLSRFRYEVWMMDRTFRSDQAVSAVVQAVRWSDLERALTSFTHLQQVELEFFVSRLAEYPPRLDDVGKEPFECVKRELVGLARKCNLRIRGFTVR